MKNVCHVNLPPLKLNSIYIWFKGLHKLLTHVLSFISLIIMIISVLQMKIWRPRESKYIIWVTQFTNLAMWCKERTHWTKPWCWERLKVGGNERPEDELVGWHHRLNRHEYKQTLGDGEGQRSLACCRSSGRKEPDTT